MAIFEGPPDYFILIEAAYYGWDYVMQNLEGIS